MQEEVFGSLVIMDSGWERADAARRAKVSEPQHIVIPPFGLSRRVIVDIYCGELVLQGLNTDLSGPAYLSSEIIFGFCCGAVMS